MPRSSKPKSHWFALRITLLVLLVLLAGVAVWCRWVYDQIGERIPLIIDGGPTGHAQPTTIVDLSLGPGLWEILREGAIPTHEIVMVLQR